MRALFLVVLLLSSRSFAAEPPVARSGTATAVKVMDWTAVSLLSVGFALQSASLLSDEARRRSGEVVDPFSPLFNASLGALFGGIMTGLVSFIVKSAVKLGDPTSDVPGPWDFVAAPASVGRVLQVVGVSAAMVGLVAFTLSGIEPRTPSLPLRVGGGAVTALGMLTAMVGGELKAEPTLSLAPTNGGLVLGMTGRW